MKNNELSSEKNQENKKIGLSPLAYNELDGEEYPPFVDSDTIVPEITLRAIVLGILIAVVFGIANAYLGLKIGLTVSASIPAAVISMGVLRSFFKNPSILENNMVQTIGSAGESLAAGMIFTLPALYLLSDQFPNEISTPTWLQMTLLALIGGILGIVFMIPLRKFLIVGEHGKLPYPEGIACAEVLVAGEASGIKALLVFVGVSAGGVYKLLMAEEGFHLWMEAPVLKISNYFKQIKCMEIGVTAIPSLLGVGYIVGFKIAAVMLAGGMAGWLVFIPLIAFFGAGSEDAVFPAVKAISQMNASQLWTNYIRYIGAGAVAVGGIMSLLKVLPVIFSSFGIAIVGMFKKNNKKEIEKRTSKDLSLPWILTIILICFLTIGFLPKIPGAWFDDVPGGFLVSFLIVLFSFFFVTVSSRIVGLVGSSSNPASGMTIATLIMTALILIASGVAGIKGMVATIAIGSVVCITICIAGDTSQDLKTGFLLGATPKKQQIGELIGVISFALVSAWVMNLLYTQYGFNSAVNPKALAAPQANLMKLIVQGMMEGNLPWGLVIVGGICAVIAELIGLPVLAFAVGLYLPLSLSTAIMTGAVIREFLERSKRKNIDESREKGILYASGLIAGEALMGVFLALFKQVKSGWLLIKYPGLFSQDISELIKTKCNLRLIHHEPVISVVMFCILIISLIWIIFKGKKPEIVGRNEVN